VEFFEQESDNTLAVVIVEEKDIELDTQSRVAKEEK